MQGAALGLPLLSTAAYAFDVNDKMSVGGVMAVTVQCQNVSNAVGFRNACATAPPLQTEISFRPTAADELSFKLGFAAGKGINGKSPLVIPPWAADLQEDVKNVNGRNRDHLLTAWYKHTFRLAHGHQLSTSIGIIDATDYLDENAYANDEYTQFMNPALTNGPNVFLPSYDVGVALEWDDGPWSLRAVLMDVGENDDGHTFRFYGLQAGYTLHNRFGTGHYRLVLAGASRDFLAPAGTHLENRAGVLLSFDQTFGTAVGGWVRAGWQTDDAAVDYNAIYSGGLDFKGTAWGRPADNVGLGYAYVNGGSLAIEQSQVVEVFYRWQLREGFGLTADVQYQQDDYKTGDGPRGWMFGLRATVEF